jgi:hypothetical protein
MQELQHTIHAGWENAGEQCPEWTPARKLRDAAKIGPATTTLFEAIEQGFRSCFGGIRLVNA